MRLIIFIIFIVMNLFTRAQEVKVEAETGQMTGTLSIVKSLPGFSGTGYVGRFENSGDKLTMTVAVPSDGLYDIFIGYCAEYGTKTINVDFNGTKSALEIPQLNRGFYEAKFATLTLKTGNASVIITPNWTWFHIDYVRIKKSEGSGTSFNIPLSPVNPAAIQPARNLYTFLRDNFQKKTISGVMTLKPLIDATNEITYLKTNTGKEPALLGLDFMDHVGSSWVNNPDLVKDAKTWWGRNGIVALCWHWRDPSRKTNAFYTENTTFDITAVNNPESNDYKAMIADMDVIAGHLKELQTAGIPVLWRPLHEAAGGWFWWGAKGADPCIKLWRLMYDRFTNVHHLNNLIWVWTTTDDSKALTWYPGDAYVDILGMDIYPGEYQHGSQVISFNKVKEIFGGKKLVTLSECGSVPYPELMEADGAYWSYFMPWYGTHTKDAKHNSVDDWKKILGSNFVVTLDEMPNLATYTSASMIDLPSADPFFTAFKSYDYITVRFRETTSLRKNLAFYNLSGQMLMRIDDVAGEHIEIPATALPKGMILLKVSAGPQTDMCKFIN